MSIWAVVGLTLGAALAFGASSALKHASAAEAPDAQSFRPRHLVRFIWHTITHNLWLSAVVCDVTGLVLQIFALHLGELSLVQPLLVSGLVFGLVLRWTFGPDSPTRRQGFWAVAVTVALAAFLLLTAWHGDHGGTEHADREPALVTGIIGVVLVLALIEAGRRMQVRHQKAALLGAAVGIVYAAMAALLKAVTDVAAHGIMGIFSSWELYAFLVAGGSGLLLNQLAFQAGPLSSSLPATATVDPLLSIVIGVLIYHERIRHGTLDTVVLVAVLLLIVVSVIQLVRETALAEPTGVEQVL